VDGTYEVAAGKDGKSSRKYIARAEEEMKKLEDLVKKAVGYSEERGDQVQVLNVAFDASAADDGAQGTEAAASNPMMGQYIRYGMFGLLALLVVLFVVRPMIKLLSAPPPVGPNIGFPPGTLPATVGQLEASFVGASPHGAVLEIARANPQSTAVVVKKWLKEK
jgi:flagellar M-ring protein FliF